MKTLFRDSKSRWLRSSLAFLLLSNFSAQAFSAAPGSSVTIESVLAHGTGCPVNTAHITISPDKQVFTAIFDAFQAMIDPFDSNVKYADRQKRCDLSLKVKVPSGWQFSIFKADYEGWYDLQPGMEMTQTSMYHFQGNDRYRKQSVIRSGTQNKSGNFNFVDDMGVSSTEWSACGAPRNMFISAEIRLASSNPQSRGVAGIDAIEGQFKLLNHYYILWRKC